MSPGAYYLILAGICAVIGTVGSGYFITKAVEEFKKPYEQKRGEFSGKILDETQTFTINLGTFYPTISVHKLKSGFNLSDYSLIKDVDIPIKIYEENKRLLFDFELKSETGELLCRVVRNKFDFNPSGKYDLNDSINAIEVVDEEKIPILQIYLKENHKIYIGGYFYHQKGQIIYYTPNGISTNKSDTKTIFKYPSDKFKGKIEQSTVENLFRLIDEERSRNEELKFKMIEYRKLSNEDIIKETENVIAKLRQYSYEKKFDFLLRRNLETDEQNPQNADALSFNTNVIRMLALAVEIETYRVPPNTLIDIKKRTKIHDLISNNGLDNIRISFNQAKNTIFLNASINELEILEKNIPLENDMSLVYSKLSDKELIYRANDFLYRVHEFIARQNDLTPVDSFLEHTTKREYEYKSKFFVESILLLNQFLIRLNDEKIPDILIRAYGNGTMFIQEFSDEIARLSNKLSHKYYQVDE